MCRYVCVYMNSIYMHVLYYITQHIERHTMHIYIINIYIYIDMTYIIYIFMYIETVHIITTTHIRPIGIHICIYTCIHVYYV